jgi:HEAT repeat protein
MLDQLLSQLVGSDDDDCEASAIALGQMGEVSLPPLKGVLSGGDIDVRFWAVRALWEMGTQSAITALLGVLDDASEMVRSGAALALGELKAEIAIAKLARVMREEQDSSGDHAADALSKLGEAATSTLIEALESARPWVRIRAARALVPIQSPNAIPALIQALDDDSYVVTHYAEEALARLGVGEIIYFKP